MKTMIKNISKNISPIKIYHDIKQKITKQKGNINKRKENNTIYKSKIKQSISKKYLKK